MDRALGAKLRQFGEYLSNQLAQRQSPEIGNYLTTIVLAVITLNQIVGPITFKSSLNLVGETGKR